jgi:hypothetical protein
MGWHTEWAGVFATAAELCRRGNYVALTLGNTPVIDFLCVSSSQQPFKIEVISAPSTKNDMPLTKRKRSTLEGEISEDLFFVFVVVRSEFSGRRFFVLSHEEARKAWLSRETHKKSGEPYKGNWFPWKLIMPYGEDEWNKLPS